jgi:polar amino acid transport system substrate-binding protein
MAQPPVICRASALLAARGSAASLPHVAIVRKDRADDCGRPTPYGKPLAARALCGSKPAPRVACRNGEGRVVGETLMRTFGIVGAIIMSMATSAAADDGAALKELAPTGKLRVAIAVGPAPSALWCIRDPASGKPKGVPIELGTAMAGNLKVPVQLVEYQASGEIIKAVNDNAWDVTFVPVDDERKKVVDFGAPYHLLQSTYLVAPGSTIKNLDEVNQPGVRIAGVEGTATFRASTKASPNATPVTVKNPDEAIALMKAGKIEAIALSRETIVQLAHMLPGSRALDGGFLNSTTAVAVGKNKPAAHAFVTAFIEQAKADGLVRRSLDMMGLKTSQIPPAGMKP